MSREPEDDTGDVDPAASPGPRDEFDRIVAAWRDEGSVPSWPDTPERPDAPEGTAVATPPAHSPDPVAGPPPVHRPGPAEADDDDHFHPPEPPPLPRPGPPALVGGTLIVLGLLLVAVPGTLGMSSLYGLPLGLVAIAAGLTWLVMRMWPSEDADEPPDDDDGAVL